VLDGDQQNPPSITHAHGYIGLKFTEDFKKLVYNVNVNNIDNITGITSTAEAKIITVEI